MSDFRLGLVEGKFADLVWQNAPITTKELVKLCAGELNWKRTTTYTVLRKMCERGLFRMEDSLVTVQMSKEEFCSVQSENFVQHHFHGSLPAFLAAFTARKKLSDEELRQIREMIDSFGERK